MGCLAAEDVLLLDERLPAELQLGFAQPAQLVDLVALMLERGYGDEDVRKFLGGNYLRLARAFWR